MSCQSGLSQWMILWIFNVVSSATWLKMKYVEYTIRLDKETSDTLVRMSEASGEDNELVYLEEMVVELINQISSKITLL